LDSKGLITDDRPSRHDFQQPYAQPAGQVASWPRAHTRGGIGLADVVAEAQPTMLIGTSTQAGAFTEQIVRTMAANGERPIIMPLSNPTAKAEARPEDLIRWTDGRALVATGSPFRRWSTTAAPTGSPRPTTHWCFPGSAWASPSPVPGASPTS